VGHARARNISAQLVEDEDYQLRYERVAGIDVAKAKADVCTRLPPIGSAQDALTGVNHNSTFSRFAQRRIAGVLLADRLSMMTNSR
jgi:hypothetical protein